MSGQPTRTTIFFYDAGNCTGTLYLNEVKVYTPFPDYEETAPTSGATTQRTTYTLAGQLIAVRVHTGATGNGATYTDHLGNVVAWSDADGALIAGSLARYEPFGGYRTGPAASVNPAISDRGFTGHRQNNTGAYDLG